MTMSMRLRTWGLLALLLPAAGAMAQEAYRPIEQRLNAEQLEQLGLSAQQLSLLNRYLAQDEAKSATTPAAVTTTTGTAMGTGPRASAPAPAASDPMRFVGLDVERLETRIRGTVTGWAPGDEFTLENGQRWQVLKGSMKLRKPLESPAVVLVPGIAGRWFLQFDEDMPKARVFRVD